MTTTVHDTCRTDPMCRRDRAEDPAWAAVTVTVATCADAARIEDSRDVHVFTGRGTDTDYAADDACLHAEAWFADRPFVFGDPVPVND